MAEWVTVASVDELPEGAVAGATVGDVAVLVASVGGRLRAIGAECTHAGCDLAEGELDPEDGTVTCACHGSIFDLDTGDAVAPPADEPVPVFDVRVEDGEVQVASPS